MKLLKVAGATSEIWQVFIRDSSSTTGAGLTGLANNTSGLTAYYHRDTDTTATVINLVTMTVGTFTSSGFKEIDATNMPGWYQLCPPNAAIAAGAKSCAFHLKGATNMAPLPIEVQLTTVNPDSATAFITAVNSLAPPTNWNLQSIDASGRVDLIKIAGTTQTARDIGASVLLSSGTGTGQLKLASGYVAMTWADIAAPTTAVNLSGTTIATTQKVDVDTIKTNPVVNGGTLTFPSGATLASTTGAVGSVTGAVGSVTGAVGSVTGAVGSVTGAVGSVTGLTASNLDVAVSTRLASASYTAPDNASIATILTDVNTGAGAIYTRIGAPAGASIAADIAAVKSDSAAVKTKTDSLTFTVANQIDANIQYVNDVLVTGNGSAGTPWGP